MNPENYEWTVVEPGEIRLENTDVVVRMFHPDSREWENYYRFGVFWKPADAEVETLVSKAMNLWNAQDHAIKWARDMAVIGVGQRPATKKEPIAEPVVSEEPADGEGLDEAASPLAGHTDERPDL